ncbi:MAG: hypothetical protein R3A79_25805 [Nannocystaceae bacterium]
MCTGGGVCDPGLTCDAGVCVAGGTSGTTTSTTDAMTSTSDASTTTGTDTEGTTTMDPGTCDPEDGLLNPACEEPSPYCSNAGICGDCSVLVSCGDVDADKSVCDVESGACVECNANESSACGGSTPICDMLTNTCVGCSAHDQCPDSACDLVSGECMDEDNVLYVLGDLENSGNCTETLFSGGTEELPYCRMDVALEHAQTNGGDWTFKLLEGSVFPQLSVEIANMGQAQTYAIVADVNTSPAVPEFKSSSPTIKLSGDFTLYVHNLDFESNAAIADYATINCDGSRLFVSDSRVRGGVGPGIRGSACELSISNSSIYNNKSEGLELAGGSLTMRNSFVVDNGPGDKWGGGGIVLNQVAVDIAYTTIVNNANPEGADSIQCDKADAPNIVRNSIIARNPNEPNQSVTCTNLKIEHSLVDGGADKGEGNMEKAADAILGLLMKGTNNGVYAVKNMSASTQINAVAQWRAGDPTTDFEGDPRPVEDLTDDTPGADVFVE